MTPSLLFLTAIVVALSITAIVKPKLLFAFPVVSSLLLLVYIIPQCWYIARSGLLDDFEPDLTWTHMLFCMVLAVVGFVAGIRTRSRRVQRTAHDFDARRLLTGALITSGVGLVAYVLMLREALTSDQGSQWTGVITLYALLASLTLFGTTLSWLFFLRTGNKIALANALLGFAVAGLTILIAARRETAFVIFASSILAMTFVRGYRPPRILIALAVVCGAIFINEAGPIRNYMTTNNATMATAIANVDLTTFDSFEATEISSAVTDIAIADWNNQYVLFDSYYNTIAHLYFPAFIFGRDAKDSLAIDLGLDDDIVGTRYNMAGSTRTGFSTSYLSFHLLGSAVFFLISFFMGTFWKKALQGDIQSQFYYIALLPDGIKIFTESTERFVGFLPFVFGWMTLVFFYARARSQTAPSSQGAIFSHSSAAL